PLSRLSVRLRASRIGSQTVLTERFSGQRVEVDGYTLLDLYGSYRVREGVSLYGRIENLLDAEYLTGFDRPGIPLMGAVGFRVGG
ncbi:MAG: TonB-dependent receptor, partial [Gemmatimonadetes bacterium]|nr:TonB-dependent receptor [Gemmatimonadota bacterium]NIR79416.1 TonB-dependent receptor [Gemmatimonadota bacterium]NIT88096.1 TonB-dependent receptor [Gemmatimonadota bacterium]NIU31923.1 TonB-dependent receptor [Gemmatimonadota bacterium]NIU36534.1 TonB-dependent receptor [Gemmatimonadota bacterium]